VIKSAIVDLQCPLGHINLINFYIKNFRKNFDYVILNKEIRKYIDNKNINFFLYKGNIFIRFFYLVKACNYLISKNVNKILFLSYDIKIFFLISIFLKLNSVKIILIEHDTLNPKKKFYFFLNKLISKLVIRLVYTKEKFYFVKKHFSDQVDIIDHPIIKDNNKSNKLYLNKKIILDNSKKIILIPSRFNIDFKLLYNFINNHKNILFLVLSKKVKILDNVVFVENIRENIIKKINAIYLPLDSNIYRYRVSSWIYKAIAYKKKIILDKGFTYNFEKKRFGNLVVNSEEDINFFLKKKIYIKSKFLRNYNLRLISNMKKLLK
jgi:hypothetical protein